MNWKDTDEHTVMHMMGYSANIWSLPIFREAVLEYSLDIPTLQYLVDYYIRTWGSNNDLEEIAEYLKFVENKEVYR